MIGIGDDTIRRDSIHKDINNLPDVHYACTRALALVGNIYCLCFASLTCCRIEQHLNRVGQHSARNKMTTEDLAVVFG